MVGFLFNIMIKMNNLKYYYYTLYGELTLLLLGRQVIDQIIIIIEKKNIIKLLPQTMMTLTQIIK